MKKNILLLTIMLILAVLFIAVLLYKHVTQQQVTAEGFEATTDKKYTLKRDQAIYDNFYANHYTEVSAIPSRIEQEWTAIVQQTQADPNQSIILDIGAGNGELMQALIQQGFTQVFGIDKSQAMVNAATSTQVKEKLTCSDALETMNFESSLFSHILCMHYTLYEITDRIQLFRNVARWLKAGGVFVVHLMDNQSAVTQPQTETKHIKQGTTQYKQTMEFDKNRIVKKETFKMADGKVRENESSYALDKIQQIVDDVIYCGFIVQGKFKMTEQDYLYFFEKIR